jgi:dTDP-4-dehydrorhamnose 3,5-epimerase
MIESVFVTPLPRIKAKEGDVLRAIRFEDVGYLGFGEVYFSMLNRGATKAWKLHKEMTMNIVVPYGDVLIVTIDGRDSSPTLNEQKAFRLSPTLYYRLTVPPMFWVGFKSLGASESIIMNFSNFIHSEDEVVRKDLASFFVDWNSIT